MSALLPAAVFGLKVPAGDVAIPAVLASCPYMLLQLANVR